jgi:hypothetical protein
MITMTTSVLAIAEPPWEMATPHTAQMIITVILGVVVAAFALAALYDWRRTGRPTFVLMLVGGYVCSFNEALVDVLGHCYFPGDGVIAYTAFDRPVPVWVVLAYVVFFGGLSYLMSEAFKRGASRRAMWAGISIFGVLNVLLEIPMLRSGLYLYYGAQSFEVGGFPIIWLVINSLGSLFAAVVITRLSWFFTGARQLLLVAVPFATYMASWVLTMPHFAITNTDASGATRAAAAIVSMVLGLIAIDALIRIGTGQWRLLPAQFADTNTEHRAHAHT